MPRIIYHIPARIITNLASGSQIRPMKMLQAFKNAGYMVDFIEGKALDRKRKIREVKKKIQEGAEYEFVYSETSTEPSLLTEEHHLPLYPFLDHGFLSYCAGLGLPIGLFYRDIYWEFDFYKEMVPLHKRLVARFFYMYDLKQYKKYLNTMFLPTKRMSKYLPINFEGHIHDLPPAAMFDSELKENLENRVIEKPLELFYVGGFNLIYKMKELFKTIAQNKRVKLTFCCRKNEWEEYGSSYQQYLSDNIEIIHLSGKDLEPYFKRADLFSLFVEPHEYRDFAMPVKLFEYMSHGKPIISTINTAVGDFVEKYDIGWSIEYNSESLNQLFQRILNNESDYQNKRKNIFESLKENTWESRVKEIKKVLTQSPQ